MKALTYHGPHHVS
ncbi:TPA: hypothetical protein RFU34_004697, partial [Klebsiella pneumoniae subsp. pneumoniae]|nr:hypothetical protein [Klebsiella pneumoniae]HDU4966994.1 hypothetical protein [Klebsiella pneumoniae subsp. pneumoniae]HED2216012.1 hypothetical protein [Klebsiella pneumoniae]